jgi:hypothetical protein
MRKLSAAAVATILAIAFYFTVFWGYEALRILTSPTYGLEDVWRSQYVFTLGHLMGLAPLGLLKLAAFFATLKLAVAVICAVHIADRFRCLMRGDANIEVLEAGLILVVAISILTVGPAVWSQNVDLVREYLVQLVLAGLAAALCLLERGYARKASALPEAEEAPVAASAPKGASYTPWR